MEKCCGLFGVSLDDVNAFIDGGQVPQSNNTGETTTVRSESDLKSLVTKLATTQHFPWEVPKL
jgi:hypothetical protein